MDLECWFRFAYERRQRKRKTERVKGEGSKGGREGSGVFPHC